jgi:predicted Fe-Mo cluster-binding NifX family protein
MFSFHFKEVKTVKVVVSSTGQDLNSQIDPRFGRCQYFVFVDTDSMKFEAVANPNISAAGGAGIQSAQMVADQGAEVVLTGNCGPNAFQTLSAAGVQVVVGVSGTVRDAVEAFKSGRSQATTAPNVADHFGVGGVQQPGMGRSSGMGMGRGGGMGMGRGMGRGGGMGRGRMGGFGSTGQANVNPNPNPNPNPNVQPQQPQSNPSEVQALREQIDSLQKQVQKLTERLENAEKSKES